MSHEWIRDELKKAGRTQTELARFLGMTTSALSRMISRGRSLRADVDRKIREFLAEASVPDAIEPENRLDLIEARLCRIERLLKLKDQP